MFSLVVITVTFVAVACASVLSSMGEAGYSLETRFTSPPGPATVDLKLFAT